MNNTMTPAEHQAAWMDRWAADYENHAERDAAYRDHQDTLATMRAVFSR